MQNVFCEMALFTVNFLSKSLTVGTRPMKLTLVPVLSGNSRLMLKIREPSLCRFVWDVMKVDLFSLPVEIF